MIDAADVVLRPLVTDDVAVMRRYFFESSPDFLISIGLKPRTAAEADQFEAGLKARLSGPDPVAVLAVEFAGTLVGFHTSTHLEPGESLIMHAHFVDERIRGRGVGTVSYVKAIERFLVEFKLRKIIFKTPKQNAAPMRIKEKLGLRPIREEVIDWPMLTGPLPVRVFEVTADDLPELKRRAGITPPS